MPDLASTRLDNALVLFDEFVRATVRHPDAATLRGLEGRFAQQLQIQPSYWSQIKSRSRQIGERLARQFEQLCHKPPGWMDVPHGVAGVVAAAVEPAASSAFLAPLRAGADVLSDDHAQPRDDDERFIVSLVLSYYRRHPQRARARLLDLLGEALAPGAQPQAPRPGTLKASGATRPPQPPAEDPHALWERTQRGVAPLKRKR